MTQENTHSHDLSHLIKSYIQESKAENSDTETSMENVLSIVGETQRKFESADTERMYNFGFLSTDGKPKEVKLPPMSLRSRVEILRSGVVYESKGSELQELEIVMLQYKVSLLNITGTEFSTSVMSAVGNWWRDWGPGDKYSVEVLSQPKHHVKKKPKWVPRIRKTEDIPAPTPTP